MNEISKSEPIEIALTSDANFYPGLFVTATSIARFAAPSVDLSFHILDGGISDENYRSLVAKIEQLHMRSRMSRIKLNMATLDGLPLYGNGRATYARLLLPRLLPNIDFVVYCDTDFIWFADIAELWPLRDAKRMLASVRDESNETLDFEQAWFTQRGLSFCRDKYFCAGLCIFNLKRMRENNVVERIFEFLHNQDSLGCADQTALNALVNESDDLQLLPRMWQRFSWNLEEDDFKAPFVLHFASDPPWRRLRQLYMLTDSMLIWFREDAVVRGCSLWQSLRQYYPAWLILFGRSFFLFVTSSRIAMSIFSGMMWLIGKKESFKLAKKFIRRIPIPIASPLKSFMSVHW